MINPPFSPSYAPVPQLAVPVPSQPLLPAPSPVVMQPSPSLVTTAQLVALAALSGALQPVVARDPLATPASLPDATTVDEQLATGKAIFQGAGKGLAVGLAVVPAIAALQIAFNKTPVSRTLYQKFFKPAVVTLKASIETGNPAIQQQLASQTQAVKSLVAETGGWVHAKTLKEAIASMEADQAKTAAFFKLEQPPTGQLIKEQGLSKQWRNVAKDVLATGVDAAFLGTLVGSGLAWLHVAEVRQKLNAIRDKAQGKTEAHRLPAGLTQRKKTKIEDPAKALEDLKQNELNTEASFWSGVKNTLILKGLALGSSAAFGIGLGGLQTGVGLIPIGVKETLAHLPEQATPWQKKLGITKGVVRSLGAGFHLMGTQWVKPIVTQPVFLTKLLITPIIGGWIAQGLAPWMNQQLGRPAPLQAAIPTEESPVSLWPAGGGSTAQVPSGGLA